MSAFIQLRISKMLLWFVANAVRSLQNRFIMKYAVSEFGVNVIELIRNFVSAFVWCVQQWKGIH